MGNVENPHVVLQIALSASERIEAIRFIETQMRRVYNCEPPATQGVICVARHEGRIVGSIALYGIEEGARFPLETYYRFHPNNSPFPFTRSEILQVGRWIAIHPNVSQLLLHASFEMAFNLGKRYALIEAKPYSVKRLLDLGFNCREIVGTVLQEDRVRDLVGTAGMRYFTESPKPSLYMIELRRT